MRYRLLLPLLLFMSCFLAVNAQGQISVAFDDTVLYCKNSDLYLNVKVNLTNLTNQKVILLSKGKHFVSRSPIIVDYCDTISGSSFFIHKFFYKSNNDWASDIIFHAPPNKFYKKKNHKQYRILCGLYETKVKPEEIIIMPSGNLSVSVIVPFNHLLEEPVGVSNGEKITRRKIQDYTLKIGISYLGICYYSNNLILHAVRDVL